LTHESIPTRTGEALLVRREGDDIVFFSPLRHHPAGSPNLRFPLSTAPLAARTALEGHETFTEFKDYRGVPALAATRYIPSTGWGLVNKIDTAEAYENVRHMAVAEELAASLLIILLGGLLAYHRRTTLMRALKQKEGEFRALLESAPDAMAITDGEGRIVLVNAQAEILFGFERQELIGKPLGRLFPEWAPERSGEDGPYDFAKVVARHVGKTFEMRGLRKGGKESLFELRLSPVKEIEGGLFSCGIRDITARKQAEQALSEAEEQFHSLFSSIPLPTLLFDAETLQYLEVNAAAASGSGYSRDELLQMRVVDLSPLENQAGIVSQIQSLHPQSLVRSEGRYRLKDGRLVDVESDLRLLDFRGRRAVLSVSQDVTARKQAESALHESEDRYRDLVENNFVMIGTHDTKGRILSVNRAAARLLEATNAEELVGRSLTAYVPLNLLPQFDEYLKSILREGHAEGLMVILAPSGKTKIFEYRNTLRRQDPNEPIIRWTGQDVTERIKAQEAQAFLASLVESSQDAIIGKTLEGIIVSWNQGAEELYGYRAEEVVGKSVSILAPPDRVDELSQLMEKARQGQRFSRCETVRVRKGGSSVNVALTISPVRDGTGKITGVVTISRDITERKLIERQTRLQTAALESAANGIMIADRGGRMLWVNPFFTRLTGYAPSEVIGQNPRVLKSGEHGAAFYRELWNTILSGGVWQGEIVNRRKDGSLYPEEMTITPVRDISGAITHFIAIKQDITERKRAEKALEERTAYLSTLIESSPLGIVVLDTEERIQMSNPAFEKLFLHSRQEMQGANLNELIVPQELMSEGESLARLCLSVGSVHTASRRCRKDGTLVDVEISGVPLVMGGEPRGILGLYQDITEHKRAEATMAERHRLATLVADVGGALTGAESLRQGLQRCTEILVRAIDAAFARVWTTNEEEKALELEASAGMYTHIDGGHARVPIGKFKIGRIAESGEPHLTNTVQEDTWVGDAEWARRERMVAFAGYPLKVEERVVGVAAAFARKPLTDATLQTFASVAANLAQFIKRKRAEQDLAEERDLLCALMDNSPDYIFFKDPESRFLRTNWAHARALGISDPSQATGKSDFDFFPLEDAKNYYEDEKKVFQTGRPLTGRVESVRHAGGELRWCSTTKVPIRDHEGRITGLVGITRDITEHKLAEEALRDNEEKYRILYESSRDAIVTLTPPEWTFTDGNPAAIALFGARDERGLVSASPWSLSPEHQPDGELSSVKARQMIDATMKTGTNSFEWTHRKFSGEEFFATVALTRMIYRGQPLLQASVRDITERKRTEEMLQLTQFSMEHASDSILWLNPQGQLVYVNEAACRSLGRSREELLSLSIPDIDPDFPPEAWKSAWAKVKAFGSMKLETHHQTKQGRVFPVEVTSNYLEFGGKEYSFAFARDITERKRAEDETRTSEERYRELFENASDIVYTTGLDTRLTSLNRMGQQILGYSVEEATQLNLQQLVVPKHWELINLSRERLLAGVSGITIEVEVTTKDGRLITLEVKPRLICKGGKPVGVQGIARDITGRDEAEMELRHAQKLESVGRLASGIAHEINTPIQFVGDNTRFLQESFESFQSLLGKYQELRSALASGAVSPDVLTEVQRVEEASDCAFLLKEVPRAIAQTLEGVDRVATIVRAMKEFAHPEGKEMAAADLNRALQSTLTVARNELKYVADVETDFGDLPLVVCNIGDLNQVFLNLLVNAAHAIGETVKGTAQKGKIRVRTLTEDSMVLIAISDTGCGIPEADRTKIFDPFFTTKEVGRGTGQGLAISRSVVVDRHKGTLTFESEEGKGTTFYVRLPVGPEACSKEAEAP
jgi:PAS domain S-box-containing protein